MSDFLYAGYIERLAKRFDEALSEIEAVHNFEYGAEFEVAICKVLRRVLPHKYAVCRGYVVDESGHTAGDDIVIFDRIRFPTLRSRDEEDFSLKEHVPIDAAYTYIEAKHTLDIDGNGESSLARATEQVARVKTLVSQRPPVSLQTLKHGISLGPALKVSGEQGWPSTRNPMFAAVLARRVRVGGRVIDVPAEVHSTLLAAEVPQGAHTPDLIVAGRSNVIIPACRDVETGAFVVSGFYLDGQSTYVRYRAPGVALAVGLCCLLWAIDWVQLDRMPWQRILANALGKLPINSSAG